MKKLYSLLLLLGAGYYAQGQSLSKTPGLLEPSGTQYFQNQYLGNPAMAGVEEGLHVNAAYRRQWNGIEGAPVTKYFTADYGLGNRVGAGLNVFNDVAGLINRTRVGLTYAYHLPLSEERKLHFGLSVAWNVQRVDNKSVNGDITDPSVAAFNRRDDYFEAEYGMAYTDKHLTLQASLPNVRSLFTGDDKAVNGGRVFYAAAGYKFTMEEDAITSLEPKLCYHGIKAGTGIVDAGVNVGILNVANVMAMYHTSKSVTGGIGVKLAKLLTIQAMYTTQTGGVKTNVDGTYEIGVTVDLFK
jgi:type IX secretion system PorP/SprF family membrane protein